MWFENDTAQWCAEIVSIGSVENGQPEGVAVAVAVKAEGRMEHMFEMLAVIAIRSNSMDETFVGRRRLEKGMGCV
jgi:hypothetical protein